MAKRKINVLVCCGGGSSTASTTPTTPTPTTPTTPTTPIPPTEDTTTTTETTGSTTTTTTTTTDTGSTTTTTTTAPSTPADTTTRYYVVRDSSFRARFKTTSLATANAMKSPTWTVSETNASTYASLGSAYNTLGTSAYHNPDYFVPEY